MEDNELQTVFTTTLPAQAEIMKVALEGEGIAAFVDGAHQAAFTGALDVYVSVAKNDAARAATLIEEMEHSDGSEEPLDAEVLDEGAG